MRGRDGVVYNLGGGSRVTPLEAIGTLESASGRTVSATRHRSSSTRG